MTDAKRPIAGKDMTETLAGAEQSGGQAPKALPEQVPIKDVTAVKNRSKATCR